jgi:two-component system response regulator HydG
MTIGLFATAKIPLPEIAAALRSEGLVVSSFVLSSDLSCKDLCTPPDKGVLLTSEKGVVTVGEQTERVREIIGDHTPLILCVPQPTNQDRKLLMECGASKIISPRSWAVEHVNERVLGQLILDGEVVPYECGDMYGATKRMRDLYWHIAKVASLSEPILILGETGTGKELVAREIHNRSRSAEIYVPVNCPEINPDLMSSELFGHEKGSFTGADRARAGLISSAGKGTVFLDEIGDLDIQSQAKLLRVLEDRKVRRVGANKFEDVQARIVLATNRDLQQACDEGKFRHDLLERIRGFTLELPPLRDRKGDIPLLVKHFVDKFNEEYNTCVKIPSGSVDHLFHYDWPGNVRELRAVVRRAAVYADGNHYINSLILQESIRGRETKVTHNIVPFDPALDTWRALLNRAQTVYFHALLSQTNGNREAAIKLSGLSKSQFFEKLKDSSKKA